jgi:hypothetical protein
MNQIETNAQSEAVARLTVICTIIACLLMLTATAVASTDSTAGEDEYVDSVYSWGIWELGLEPASGPQIPANNAINDRSRRIQFRPNDNAAYISQRIPVPQPTIITPPPPLPAAPTPIVGASGSGPVLPGMVPNSPNLR